MAIHRQVRTCGPFTGRKVAIDESLGPIIGPLWALGIETTGSCQGIPVYEQAVICFAEPRDPETPQERALFDASIEAWTASRPDGARQVAPSSSKAHGRK